MDLAVEELADVWHAGRLPGVHEAVHDVEVGDPDVGDGEGQEEGEEGGGGEVALHGEGAGGPVVAEDYLDTFTITMIDN